MDEARPDHADATLSDVDRLVIELLHAPAKERAARLDALRGEHAELARRVGRRLHVLGDYGMLGEPEPAPALPPEIGGYRILRQLGSGGMGVVYLAEQPALRRIVALKVLHGWRLGSERARARFRREALAAARLDHPSLCPVHEVGEADGVPFLAMRYVPGQTLGRRIEAARAARLPCLDLSSTGSETAAPPCSGREQVRSAALLCVALVERVARAIDTAHRVGLVHRDLKPDNILIEPDGTPVVLDFGLARDSSDEALTLSGDHVGTPAYMAPEQIAGRPTDARTDVYALGAVLYECLTLELPCPAADREALYRATLRGAAAQAATQASRFESDLRVILATAMAPEPDRRYASSLLLADDLRRYRERQPILAQPASASLRARRWTQRNPVLAASLLLLFAGLCGASLLAYQRGLALRHARSVELAHVSRQVQAGNTFSAHLLALAAVAAERNLDTISQLHAATAEVRQCAELVHTKPVNASAWSPDGTRVVTGGDDRIARLWTTGGTLVATMPHDAFVMVTLVAKDGRIVTADAAGVAKLWSPEGRPIRDLFRDGKKRSFQAGVLHRASGGCLLVGQDGLARCWRDLDVVEPVELERTASWLGTCAVSADGQRYGFAVSYRPRFDPGADFAAFVWTPRDGRVAERLVELRGHTASIVGMAFCGDGVLTVSQDGTLRRWSSAGREEWQQQHGSRPQTVVVSPDGQTIVTSDLAGDVWLWSMDGTSRRWLYRHGVQVQLVAYSPDGRRILTAGIEGSVRILDASGSELARLDGHDDFITSLAWSPDQSMVLTSSIDRTVRLWRTHTPLPRYIGHGDAVRCLALSKDGRRLLSGSYDGTMRLWEASESAPPADPTVLPSGEPLVNAVVTSVAWHPTDPGEALLCTWGQVAQRIDVRTSRVRARYELGLGHRSCRGVYSPDGKMLVLGGRALGGSVRLVDLATGGARDVRVAESLESTALAFAPDGKSFAIGTLEGTACVVDRSGRLRATLSHGDRVQGIAFSPDSRLLLTGSHDRIVRVFDLGRDPPAPLAVLHGHEAGVTSVAWSSDGRRFASASRDGTARLWSRQGEPLAVLRGHRGLVWDVTFMAGDRHVLTAGEDHTIRTWFVDAGELLATARRLAFRPFTAIELERHVLR